MIRAVLLFLLFFSSVGESASTDTKCNTVDMSHDEGVGNSNDIYQGNSNWCYAYSAATIISQKLKRPVSPLDIAIRNTYNRSVKNPDSDYFWNGASNYDVIELLKKEPYVCSTSDYDPRDPDKNMQSYGMILGAFKPVSGREYENFCEVLSVLKNIKDISELTNAIRSSKTNTEFAKKLNDQNCIDKISFPYEFEAKKFSGSWNSKSLEENGRYLRSKLNDGKILATGVDTSLMFKGRGSWFEDQKAHLGLESLHSVSLIGMYEKNGRCFYRVRDSAYGAADMCGEYKRSSEVTCGENATYDVPEDLFLKSVKDSLSVAD